MLRLKKPGETLPLLIGVTVLLAYLNFATATFHFSSVVTITLAFAIGPAAIFGMLEIYRGFGSAQSSPLLRAGLTFLVIGFSLLTLMLVVQQAVFQGLSSQLQDTEPGYRAVSVGLNLVQLGIDVAFDIFYSLGLVLLGLFLSQQEGFGPVTGYTGSFLGLTLLILNLSTFPWPPADQGLVDVGPYTGLWWFMFIGQSLWAKWKSDRDDDLETA